MSESSSRRPLIFALIALLVAGGLGAWFWLGADTSGEVAQAEGEGNNDKAELLERKRAARRDTAPKAAVAVVGTVTAKVDGHGIEGATVFLNRRAVNQGVIREPGRPAEPMYAITDAKGDFRIEGVPAGRYAISASAKDFKPATIKDFVVKGDGEQRVELTMSAGGLSLSGVVTDVGGGPIEGVLMRVDTTEGANFAGMNRAPIAAVTNEEGRYETFVGPGRYVVTSYHPDYVGNFRMTHIEDGPRVEDFELIPSATIEGVVRSRADGKPVANASVTFADSRNGQSGMNFRTNFSLDGRQVLTDEGGHFAITGLYSGVVKVDARGEHHAAREPLEVQVGIGETVTDVEILVDAAFKVSGFVVPQDDKEAGIPDVIVGAYTLSPFSLIASGTPSTEDGYFEIHGLEPGAYTIGALSELALPKIAGVGIEVKDADIDDVVLELDRGVHVSGRVSPPETAQVDVSLDAKDLGIGNMFDAVTTAFAGKRSAEDGTFDVGPLKPGTYTFTAKGTSGASVKIELEVPEGGLENVELVLEPKASVQGWVRDEVGAPIAGANVQLVSMQGGEFNMGAAMRGGQGTGFATGEDGSFNARGYDAGEYMVSVNDRRGRRMELANDEKVIVELAAAQAKMNVEVTVTSTQGEIGGVVLDGEGLPVADAWVRASRDVSAKEFGEMVGPARPERKRAERKEGVMPPKEKDDKPDDFTMPEYFAEAPVLTDEAGHFLIKKLSPGHEYVVVAEGDRGGSKVRESGVQPGAELTLTLATLGSLSGTVTGPKGPLAEYSVTLSGPNQRSKRVREATGAFEFARLEAGTYEVKIDAKEGTAKAEVELESGKPATVDLELEGFATITGTLVNANDGKPIPKMMVLLVPEDGDFDGTQIMKMMMGGGTKTDGDGEFKVRKVKEGKGELVFMDPSGGMMSGAGAVASVDYEVEAGDELALGDVNGVLPAGLSDEEKGELGIDLGVRTYERRPRPVGTVLEDEDEDPEADADKTERLWVLWVEVGGPADEAGLEPGDEVMVIDGKPVAETGARAAELSVGGARVRVGQKVEFQIDRQGSSSTKSVEARAEDEAKD